MKSPIKKLTDMPIDDKAASIDSASVMAQTFSQRQQELEKNLKHAYRYGTSAFRYGLIPVGISDHLPIIAKLPINVRDIKMLSWNLLADEHLFNNFMNISGSSILQDELNAKLGKEDNIYNGAMYHLFAELAQFIYSKIPVESNEMTIDLKLLKDFISNEAQPSRKARSRTPETTQENVRKVELARTKLVEILTDPDHPNAHEYQLAIRQSIELIYHIKNPSGALRWENRFARLKENRNALDEFLSQDIIALQECTSPSDIESLFINNKQGNKRMSFISHTISNASIPTDNVVLAFDESKFNLLETTAYNNPLKTNFEGKKPAIFCKLQDVATGNIFIVGSIHHPGGDEDLRHEIVNSIRLLQEDDPNIPFFIAGDYNHTAEQFNQSNASENDLPKLFYPTDIGTMAGSDYGNTNESIDAIMSSEDLSARVAISSAIKFSSPADTPIKLNFNLSSTSQEDSARDSLMKKNILAAIIIAKDNYLEKKYRPGYPQAIPDLKIKESIEDLEELYRKVDQSDDGIIALNYLTDQLTDKHANWSDYDFNNYLIDALKTIARDHTQSISVIDWDCFTPTAVKRFEGVVYRGTSSPPEKVFKTGFNDYVPSSDISDYTKYRNLNTGVSTSRSYDLAESYTRVASRRGRSRFVYTILYRGIGAVDIVETAKYRGIDLYSLTNPQATKALEKDEINIIDRIPPEQILYATEFLEDGSSIIHKNPNYKGSYIVNEVNFADDHPHIERSLFTKIYDFFAELVSFFKTLHWSIYNQDKINDYGVDSRNREISSNPIMCEAEAIFEQVRNTNSFELISAHLAVDEPVKPVIPAQPDNTQQIITEEITYSENTFEIIEDIGKLGAPLKL